MKIKRKDAIRYLSTLRLLKIENKKEMNDILLDTGEVFDDKDIESLNNTSLLIKYFEWEFIGVTNEYISELLFNSFQKKIEVIGIVENLYACRCCKYKTIKNPNNYEICKICGWEDVGAIESQKYSSVNRMTLDDAMTMFEEKIKKKEISNNRLLCFRKKE